MSHTRDDRRLNPPIPGESDLLEVLLRDMRLREPSRELDDRISAVLRGAGQSGRAAPRGLPFWIGLAAAVAVAGAVGPQIARRLGQPVRTEAKQTPIVPAEALPTSIEAPAAPVSHVRPLQVRNTVVRVADDGIVGQLGDTPLRRIRRLSVRQAWAADPDGTRGAAAAPTEDVFVVRVRPF